MGFEVATVSGSPEMVAGGLGDETRKGQISHQPTAEGSWVGGGGGPAGGGGRRGRPANKDNQKQNKAEK